MFSRPAFLIFLRILRISISRSFISQETLAKDGIVSVTAFLKEHCDARSGGGMSIPNHLKGSDIGSSAAESFSTDGGFSSFCNRSPLKVFVAGGSVLTVMTSSSGCPTALGREISCAGVLMLLFQHSQYFLARSRMTIETHNLVEACIRSS